MSGRTSAVKTAERNLLQIPRRAQRHAFAAFATKGPMAPFAVKFGMHLGALAVFSAAVQCTTACAHRRRLCACAAREQTVGTKVRQNDIGLSQNGPKGLKRRQNNSKWLKMAQNTLKMGQNRSTLAQNGPKGSKYAQNGSKWLKIGPKWLKMAQNRPKKGTGPENIANNPKGHFGPVLRHFEPFRQRRRLWPPTTAPNISQNSSKWLRISRK